MNRRILRGPTYYPRTMPRKIVIKPPKLRLNKQILRILSGAAAKPETYKYTPCGTACTSANSCSLFPCCG